MTSQAAMWEEAAPGWGEVFRSLLDDQAAMDAIERPQRAMVATLQEGDIRAADGTLYVMPENEPAVYLWLFHLCQQWDRDAFGNILGFRSGVALEFARELAARDRDLQPLRLVEDVSVIASTAFPLLQAHQQATAEREAEQQRQNVPVRRVR